MAEQGGRHNHAGVIAALIHLQIRAASESHLHFDEHFALSHARDGHSFDLEIFFAVKTAAVIFPFTACFLPRPHIDGNPGLNHDFHRVRLRMGSEFQRSADPPEAETDG